MFLLITLACTGENITASDLANDTGVVDPNDLDGDGYTPDQGDCDDDNPDISPGTVESCDEIDNDCDGEVDEDAVDATSLYADVDGDGYGNTGNAVRSCGTVEGRVETSGDCDDTNADINPGATEVCDEWETDEDCDGLADDDDESTDVSGYTTWYADADGDGFGDASVTDELCHGGEGWVDDNTDCDDTDSWLTPENECDLGWNGTYSGTFTYTATVSGFSDTCAGSISFDIVELDAPPIDATFTCTWAALASTETVLITGDFNDDETQMSGTMQVGDAVLEPWTGDLTDEPRLSSEFAGATEIFGQAVDYTGALDIAR